MRAALTAERLREALAYCPDTGEFRWRIAKKGTRGLNSVAGNRHHDGYVMICLDYHKHLAHRLVWLYVHGCWPAKCIDHINCDRSDNRLVNLREATPQQNKYNQLRRDRNTTGFKGVQPALGNTAGWRFVIGHNGESIHLGTFNTAEEAAAAYIGAARVLAREFARAA